MCAFGRCIFSPFALDFVTICLSIFYFSIKMKELNVCVKKKQFLKKKKLLHKLFSMQNTSQVCRCMYGISFCLLHFLSIFIIYISYCFAIVSICRLLNALHLPTASVVHFSCDRSTTHGLNSTKSRENKCKKRWQNERKKNIDEMCICIISIK